MKNKIYCVFCGTENSVKDKRCKKCYRKLNPKERPIFDYIKSKVSDKYSGDLKDNVTSIIINFIKSHLYGTIFTCSVIISAVSIVVNANVNNYEKVKEKPVITNKYTYIGEGLTTSEIVDKYINAIKENDLKTIESLQLENFYPEVVEYVKGKKYTNESYGYFSDAFQISEHELVDRKSVFLSDNLYLNVYDSSELVVPNGNYGDYNFYRYVIHMGYCYSNDCRIIDEKEVSDYSSRIVIELIEVDDNYYIGGEKVAKFRDTLEETMYYLLLKYDGDTSLITHDVINYYIPKCGNSENVEQCVNE